MRLLLPSRDSLDVVVSALFAHQVPARAAHAAVAAISGPTAAVISAGVVTFSSGRTPASGMGCPHVVGDRMLKVVVAHLAQLTEGLFLDLGLRLRRRPSGGLDEGCPGVRRGRRVCSSSLSDPGPGLASSRFSGQMLSEREEDSQRSPVHRKFDQSWSRVAWFRQ